jgi:mono/diheme cytochrome c family protein
VTVERSDAPVPAQPTRPEGSRPPAAGLFKGLTNVLSVALIIYLTYYFTAFFSRKHPEPATVSEAVRAAAKKIEERLADERKLLSTYGPLNPATGAVRIPIERAMDLIVAESAPRTSTVVKEVSPKPEPTGGVPKTEAVASALKPEVVAVSPKPEAVAAPAAAPEPARGGMSPAQLYRAICIACHDSDGRGSIVRKAIPAIPDFTDPKWQSSRTDAELQHTMLEGKGQLMLPMKDKFALARTDVKEMLAFVRGFQPGQPGVATAPQPQPASQETAPTAVAPSVPAASPTAAIPAASPAASSTSALAMAMAEPAPELPAGLLPPPTPVVSSPPSVPTSPRRTVATNPVSAARLKAAAGLYQVNCMACHGPDGRGNIIRAVMPPIPDFTSREWQSVHNATQLSVSILEGKGALMPPWHGKLTPEQARDLVSYVRTFGPADLEIAEAPMSDFGHRFQELSNRFQELKKQWTELDQQVRLLSPPRARVHGG